LPKSAASWLSLLNLLNPAPAKKAPASVIDVTHGGATYRVALKRSATAKRMTLRVRSAARDVVLTVPQRVALRHAQEFARNHAHWIAERLARLPERCAFAPEVRIPFRGQEHVLRHFSARPAGKGPVWLDSATAPPAICASGDTAHFERRIADFLRREAKKELERSVARHVIAIGRAPMSISLRDTSSRWGSCSSKGALNFSWRLILAPPFVLDYLAAHETAHLRHHNHSDKFWALTQSLCPRMDEAEAWLKTQGAQLHRYGPNPRARGASDLSDG
jgi:predicted metal-dependent hydrolase